LGGRKPPITAPVAYADETVTAMKETSSNVEAKGSEDDTPIENEVCSRISLRFYIKGGSIEKGRRC
jgi:hypothetical protein